MSGPRILGYSVFMFFSLNTLTESGSITKLLSTVWEAATNQSVSQVLHLCRKKPLRMAARWKETKNSEHFIYEKKGKRAAEG